MKQRKISTISGHCRIVGAPSTRLKVRCSISLASCLRIVEPTRSHFSPIRQTYRPTTVRRRHVNGTSATWKTLLGAPTHVRAARFAADAAATNPTADADERNGRGSAGVAQVADGRARPVDKVRASRRQHGGLTLTLTLTLSRTLPRTPNPTHNL